MKEAALVRYTRLKRLEKLFVKYIKYLNQLATVHRDSVDVNSFQIRK